MRSKPNPNFEREVKRELTCTLPRTAKPVVDRIVNQVVDQVSRTHRQRDKAEVRRALTAAAARHGIHNWIPSGEVVQAVAEGWPV